MARPLHDMTKKGVKFQWSARQEETFQELKKCLMKKPPLILPYLKKPFEIHYDACGDCLWRSIASKKGNQ